MLDEYRRKKLLKMIAKITRYSINTSISIEELFVTKYSLLNVYYRSLERLKSDEKELAKRELILYTVKPIAKFAGQNQYGEPINEYSEYSKIKLTKYGLSQVRVSFLYHLFNAEPAGTIAIMLALFSLRADLWKTMKLILDYLYLIYHWF